MDETAIGNLGLLILLLPAIGAVLAGVLGPRLLKGQSHWPVLLGVGGSAVAALLMLQKVYAGVQSGHTEPVIHPLYDWFSAVSDSWFSVELWIDPLTAVMMAMVCFVSTFVVMYSKEYMRHDGHPERGYERFFAFLGMFVCAMGILVLGGNFLLLYMGWEAVGLCSYLLIGFYYRQAIGRRGGEEGVSGQPNRRLWFRPGHLPDLPDLRALGLRHSVQSRGRGVARSRRSTGQFALDCRE